MSVAKRTRSSAKAETQEEMGNFKRLYKTLMALKHEAGNPRNLIRSAAKMAILETLLDNICKVEGNYYRIRILDPWEDASVCDTGKDSPRYVCTKLGIEAIFYKNPSPRWWGCGIYLFHERDEPAKCLGMAIFRIDVDDLRKFMDPITGDMQEYAKDTAFFVELLDSQNV